MTSTPTGIPQSIVGEDADPDLTLDLNLRCAYRALQDLYLHERECLACRRGDNCHERQNLSIAHRALAAYVKPINACTAEALHQSLWNVWVTAALVAENLLVTHGEACWICSQSRAAQLMQHLLAGVDAVPGGYEYLRRLAPR